MSFLQYIVLVLFLERQMTVDMSSIMIQIWVLFFSFRIIESINYMVEKARRKTYNSVFLPIGFKKPQIEEILVRYRLKMFGNICLFWEWASFLIIQLAPFRYFFPIVVMVMANCHGMLLSLMDKIILKVEIVLWVFC